VDLGRRAAGAAMKAEPVARVVRVSPHLILGRRPKEYRMALEVLGWLWINPVFPHELRAELERVGLREYGEQLIDRRYCSGLRDR
jgi:hypothetical protein